MLPNICLGGDVLKKKGIIWLVVLMSVLLVGCIQDKHVINMEVARPYHNDEEKDVKYYYTLGMGAYEGKRYSLMGTHDSKLAYVIRNIERSYSNHVVIHLWMTNVSKDPITFDIDGFRILSPDGKTYSLDGDYQLDRAVRVSGAEYGYLTLQPGEQKQTFLYFNVPGIKMDDLSGWRFGFSSSSHLSFIGILGGLLREANYVWLYPAYKEEVISK